VRIPEAELRERPGTTPQSKFYAIIATSSVS
jgi:hypothetical protein